MRVGNGNVGLALEGGYKISMLQECVGSCVSSLLGESGDGHPPFTPKVIN